MPLRENMIKELGTFLAIKQVNPELIRLEKSLQLKLRRLFNQVGAEIERQLEKSGALGNPAQTARAMTDITPEFAATIAAEIEKFQNIPRNVVEVFRDKVFNASTATLERLKGDVMATIAQGASEGVGPRVVARSLRTEFKNMKDFELERIARSELKQAQGLSTQGQFLDRGVEYQQWSTNIDGRERESHAEIDGEIIRVGDTFSNGLRFPGDPDGEPEEIINCRCTVVPFIMPLGKAAPAGQEQFRKGDLVTVEATRDAIRTL